MKVAVVIPVYNEEDFILKTLNCFRQQKADYKDFALVIVDNGSTDRSLELIETFARKNKKIKIVLGFEKKKGSRFSRKRALDLACSLKPEIIASTDADTMLPKDFISQIINFFESTRYDVLSGKIFMPAKTRLLRLVFFPELTNLVQTQWIFETRLFGPYFFGAYFALRSSFYKRIPLFEVDPVPTALEQEDIILSKRCVYLGAKFHPSKNHVIVSDRRFWGNIASWLSGKRNVDFRNQEKEIDHLKFSEEAKKQMIQKRYNLFSDRVMALLWDAYLFWEKTNHLFPIPHKIVKNVTSHFGIPLEQFIQGLDVNEPILFYKKISNQYKEIVKNKAKREIEGFLVGKKWRNKGQNLY